MDAELPDRLASVSKSASEGDAQTMARVAFEQMKIGEKNMDK